MSDFCRKAKNLDFSKEHTKQLLELKRLVNISISEEIHCFSYNRAVYTTQDFFLKLKEELATREHVPNKDEAKILRQEKAKEKRNR